MKPVGPKPSPLSPSVRDLVAHERVPPALPQDVRARLLSRAHLATLEGPPATQPVGVMRTGAGQALVAGAAAVAAGIAAAVYLLGGSAPSAPAAKATATATVTATAAPPEPSAAPTTRSDGAAAPSVRAQPFESPIPSARPKATSRSENGPEEIQLLSRARQADARGDYAGVLSILSEHERSFPAGRLSEEREVLRVKALVGLGRTEQARRSAARFRRQFPRSVLLHKIDEMLASMP